MERLRLYNTLTRSKDEFAPADGETVKMYCCGPTVYNFAHIGNLRTYIFEDLLRRMLQRCGWDVRHVMNITDVGHMTSDSDAGEDKMMKAAQREQRSPWEIARIYEDAFLRDLDRLNIRRPSVLPRATEHVVQMIELIEKLQERGFTYRTDEGIYFDTARDETYGKLAGLDIAGQIEGAREDVNVNPQKRHPADFILWFTNKPGHIMQWDSPWGRGYPGWHIECSAMSMTYLGETLDIHCGGIDHIPVHNTNEIAQSECATGHVFARFWVHGAFLNVKSPTSKNSETSSSRKMAKSGENFITVDRLVDRGFDPLAYRYYAMNAHYRSELAFSWDALESARRALARIYELRGRLGERVADDPLNPAQYEAATQEVEAALRDDLNLPRALAALHDAGSFRLWRAFDDILGLDIDRRSRPAREKFAEPPSDIAELIALRNQARASRDWTESDRLRVEIESKGYIVGDQIGGASESKLRLV